MEEGAKMVYLSDTGPFAMRWRLGEEGRCEGKLVVGLQKWTGKTLPP